MKKSNQKKEYLPDCYIPFNLDKTLENISHNLGEKVNHIIVGHTVQKTINSKCDNKVFRVDVGLSKALGSGRLEGRNRFGSTCLTLELSFNCASLLSSLCICFISGVLLLAFEPKEARITYRLQGP